MKGKIKRISAMVLCVALLFTMMNTAFAQESRTAVDSGFCGAQGENLAWTLYDDGELVISGEGEMDWYSVDWEGNKYTVSNPVKRPGWFDYYDKIYVITVEEGVTSIGNDAFYTGMPSRGFEPSIYYKINLPKSLVFFEDMFSSNAYNRIEGKHLAYVYAGSEGEWNSIEDRVALINFDKNRVPVERVYGSISQHSTPKIKDRYSELYFNGKEPEDFCKIVSSQSEDVNYTAYYYTSNPKAETIEWYTVNNGEETKIGEISITENEAKTMMIPNYKEGNVYLKAKIVDSDGNVIIESKEWYIGTEYPFFTKVEMYFQLLGFNLNLYFMIISNMIKTYFTNLFSGIFR